MRLLGRFDGIRPEHVVEFADSLRQRFLARAAPTLFAPAHCQPVQLSPVPPWRPANPCVARHDGRLWCAVRMWNKAPGGRPDYYSHSHSLMLELDENLRTLSTVRIDEPTDDVLPHCRIRGFEDVRLISCGAVLRGVATVMDRVPREQAQVVVFELTTRGEVPWMALQHFGTGRWQKNWLPFCDDNGLGLVYTTAPTQVMRFDETSRQCTPWRSFEDASPVGELRGGSPLIPFDGGWLYVVHQTFGGVWYTRRYLHRFVFLAADFSPRAMSPAFYFFEPLIEFCAGMVESADGRKLHLSVGRLDREAWFVTLDAAAVRRSLRPFAAGKGDGSPKSLRRDHLFQVRRPPVSR